LPGATRAAWYTHAMNTRASILSAALEGAYPLFTRYLAGFGDSTRTRQASGLPNHAAWTLGHLAMYHHQAADRLLGLDEGRRLPATDFAVPGGDGGDGGGGGGGGVHRLEAGATGGGGGGGGVPESFDPATVCNGSTPIDDPLIYPAWSRCRAIHDAAWARLVETVRAGDDGSFDRPVNWGTRGTDCFPGERLVSRMLFHLAMHGGQLTDLRRALGMGMVNG